MLITWMCQLTSNYMLMLSFLYVFIFGGFYFCSICESVDPLAFLFIFFAEILDTVIKYGIQIKQNNKILSFGYYRINFNSYISHSNYLDFPFVFFEEVTHYYQI